MGRVASDTTYHPILILNVVRASMLWRPSWEHEVTGMRTKNHLERMVERTHFPRLHPTNLGHPTHSRPHPLSPAWWLQPLTRCCLMINSGSQAAKMENHGEMLALSTVMVPTRKVFGAEQREAPARVGLACMLS